MSEANDKIIALNVRLKPSESSAHPRATNYTNDGGPGDCLCRFRLHRAYAARRHRQDGEG